MRLSKKRLLDDSVIYQRKMWGQVSTFDNRLCPVSDASSMGFVKCHDLTPGFPVIEAHGILA
jgi:hypothetical protein